MTEVPTIVGQGLAGTCLAWWFWLRALEFSAVDLGSGGSSRVAAGLVNPITGKNFEPSWRLAEFLPEAIAFYEEVGRHLGVKLWYPLKVLRLAGSEKEWAKISSKLGDEGVRPWVGMPVEPPAGWIGAVEVTGGGRLDTKTFIDASRSFFRERGRYREAGAPEEGRRIWCEGAAGLIAGKYGPHRCAKGEILTIETEGWDESRIRVGGGGWLLPIGEGKFRAGATYEWNELDQSPTDKGREWVERIIRKLGGEDFRIVSHEAGIRPILRRSEPLIGPVGAGGDWMFNGLGSKGSLYAPGVAARLMKWMVEGIECDEDLDYRRFPKS